MACIVLIRKKVKRVVCETFCVQMDRLRRRKLAEVPVTLFGAIFLIIMSQGQLRDQLSLKRVLLLNNAGNFSLPNSGF
jgi:hypothetical protein